MNISTKKTKLEVHQHILGMSSIEAGEKNFTLWKWRIIHLYRRSLSCSNSIASHWKTWSGDQRQFLKPLNPLTEYNYHQSFSFYAYVNTCMSTLNASWKSLQTFVHIKAHHRYKTWWSLAEWRKTWHLQWQTQFGKSSKTVISTLKRWKISGASQCF